MRQFLIFFTFLISQPVFAAMDLASQFVDQTLTEARQVMEEKDDTARTVGLCNLLKQKLGSDYISNVWLGTYATIPREATAVQIFRDLVPSIMISKALPLIGGSSEGSIVVGDTAKERGNNIYEVGVTVTANNKAYKGFAIVEKVGTLFKINDAEYMGLSAVNYQGRDFQQFMKRDFDKDPLNSLPVTALIQHITSQSDYVSCP